MFYSNANFEQLYDEGLTALMRGDIKTAEELFTKSLELNRDSPLVYYQLGRCALRSGDLPRAKDYFESAVQKQPEHVPSLAELGFVHLCQNELDKARQWFGKALGCRANHSKSLLGLGITYFLEGQWDIAYEWIKKSVTTGGAQFMGLYMLAKTAKILGFLEESEEYFNKAEQVMEKSTEVAPEQPESYYLRGEIYLAKEHYNKACEFFKEAEKRIQRDRTYYFYHEVFRWIDTVGKQGICLLQLGKTDEAKKIGAIILEADPENRIGKMLTQEKPPNEPTEPQPQPSDNPT